MSMSKAKSKSTNWVGTPWLNISENAVLDNLTRSKSWGMIMGNPSIAINEACCIALEAMAANMVKTRLSPIAPTREIKKNCKKEVVRSPINAVNKIRLITLIKSIKITL